MTTATKRKYTEFKDLSEVAAPVNPYVGLLYWADHQTRDYAASPEGTALFELTDESRIVEIYFPPFAFIPNPQNWTSFNKSYPYYERLLSILCYCAYRIPQVSVGGGIPSVLVTLEMMEKNPEQTDFRDGGRRLRIVCQGPTRRQRFEAEQKATRPEEAAEGEPPDDDDDDDAGGRPPRSIRRADSNRSINGNAAGAAGVNPYNGIKTKKPRDVADVLQKLFDDFNKEERKRQDVADLSEQPEKTQFNRRGNGFSLSKTEWIRLIALYTMTDITGKMAEYHGEDVTNPESPISPLRVFNIGFSQVSAIPWAHPDFTKESSYICKDPTGQYSRGYWYPHPGQVYRMQRMMEMSHLEFPHYMFPNLRLRKPPPPIREASIIGRHRANLEQEAQGHRFDQEVKFHEQPTYVPPSHLGPLQLMALANFDEHQAIDAMLTAEPENVKKYCEMRREAQKRQLDMLSAYWRTHSESSSVQIQSPYSSAYRAIIRWGEEHLDKFPNFCIPADRVTSDLPSFAEMVIHEISRFEMAHRVDTAHSPVMVILCAALDVYRKTKMHAHPFLYGSQSVGKSFMLLLAKECLIPGTVLMMMAQTARAFTSGSNEYSDMIFCFEEAPASMMELRDGGGSRSSAENAEATLIKNILTSEENTVAVCSNEGDRRSMVITTEANNVMMFCSNIDANKLSGPMKSRLFMMMIQPSQRLDRGPSDTNGSAPHPDQQAALEFSKMLMRRDQYIIALVCEAIRRQIMKPVNLAVVDDVIAQFLALALDNGAFVGLKDNRNVERIKGLVHSLVIKYAIRLVFDYELAPLRRSKAVPSQMDPTRRFELTDILLLEPYLVATPEIVWYAMELGMCQFRDMGEQTVIKAIKEALFSGKGGKDYDLVDMYYSTNILASDLRKPGQTVSSSGPAGDTEDEDLLAAFSEEHDRKSSVEHVTHDKQINDTAASELVVARPTEEKKTRRKKNDVSDVPPIQGYFSPARRSKPSEDASSDSISVIMRETRRSLEEQLHAQQQQPPAPTRGPGRPRKDTPSFSSYRAAADLSQQLPFSALDRCRVLASRIAPFIKTRISDEHVAYVLLQLTTRHVIVDSAMETTKSCPVLTIKQKGDVGVIQTAIDRIDEDAETQVLLKVFQAPGCKGRLQIRARSVPGFPAILQTVQLHDVEAKDTSLDVLRAQSNGHYRELQRRLKSREQEGENGDGAASSTAPLLDQLRNKRVVTNPYHYSAGVVGFFNNSIRSAARTLPNATPSNFDIHHIAAPSRLAISAMGDFKRVLKQHLRVVGWSSDMLMSEWMPPVESHEYDHLVKRVYAQHGRVLPTYVEFFRLNRTAEQAIDEDIANIPLENPDEDVVAHFEPPRVGMALFNMLSFVPAAPGGAIQAPPEESETKSQYRVIEAVSRPFRPLRERSNRSANDDEGEEAEEPPNVLFELPLRQRAVSTSSSNRSSTPRMRFSPVEADPDEDPEPMSFTERLDAFKKKTKHQTTLPRAGGMALHKARQEMIQKLARSVEPEVSSNSDAAPSVVSMFDGIEDDDVDEDSLFMES